MNERTDEELVAGLMELLAVGTGLAREALAEHLEPGSPMLAWLEMTGASFAIAAGAEALWDGAELDPAVREGIEKVLRDA